MAGCDGRLMRWKATVMRWEGSDAMGGCNGTSRSEPASAEASTSKHIGYSPQALDVEISEKKGTRSIDPTYSCVVYQFNNYSPCRV